MRCAPYLPTERGRREQEGKIFMFDHQISRFEKRITDLPDQPTLAPDALKAWFDSAPEQLRQALNQVCADGRKLEERVESLVLSAYGGTVTREMLTDTLRGEIEGKAEKTAVQDAVGSLSDAISQSAQSCEASAAAGDAAVQARMDSLFAFGTYEGDGEESQFISLGFTPRAVLMCRTDGAFSQGNVIYGGLATAASPAKTAAIAEGGFDALNTAAQYSGNHAMYTFKYIALR